jgi:hypothetical protein
MKLTNLIVNHTRLLGASLLLTILAILGIWHFGALSGEAQSTGGFAHALFAVVPDPSKSTLPTSIPTTPTAFYIEGNIIPLENVTRDGTVLSTEVSLGTWRAWGVLAPGGEIVSNQEFWLPSYNGVIEAQGVIGRTSLAIEGGEGFVVSGGLGTYRTTFGEAQIKPFGTGTFRFDRVFRVDLHEINRRPYLPVTPGSTH